MDPSKRNAEALNQRVDDICDGLINHFSKIMSLAEVGPNDDFSSTAHSELSIIEQKEALIRSARELSSFIRGLQELWLFGGLDTLTDPSDEEANTTKALAVAAMIETLAKHKQEAEPHKQQLVMGGKV